MRAAVGGQTRDPSTVSKFSTEGEGWKVLLPPANKEVEFRPLTSQRKNVLGIKLGRNEATSREKN